ncbi:Pimeloyl-ACP methyl ester carboxylesterase [Goodfellowiella coeruleoviolacea]|uniref:Pimeloyl-ACP methyl ester carboxylesterase n=2 Tax=Goodfellowiella coeruleoviolacea TaxID=334858 RepID=A0AAE3GMU3_9PSEU|nr:Pimeloyl-ACP methyl ester carboxylesterase [Goodfellowiella coeruleoviolacea]
MTEFSVRVMSTIPQRTVELAHTVRGDGPALLLAHGAGGGIDANYGPLMAELTAGHTVIAPDLPGAGRTPRSSTPLDLDELADQLIATADAAGVDQVTILGYSLGTTLAVRAAARHPERVRGLVLTAGWTRPDAHLRLAADLWLRLLAESDRANLARFVTLVGLGATFRAGLSDDQLDEILRETAAGLPEGTPEQVELASRTDTSADLAGIRVPTLVVATTEDQLVLPANSVALAEGIAGARLVEIAAGHMLMAERPTEWQTVIAEFLREHQL